MSGLREVMLSTFGKVLEIIMGAIQEQIPVSQVFVSGSDLPSVRSDLEQAVTLEAEPRFLEIVGVSHFFSERTD